MLLSLEKVREVLVVITTFYHQGPKVCFTSRYFLLLYLRLGHFSFTETTKLAYLPHNLKKLCLHFTQACILVHTYISTENAK